MPSGCRAAARSPATRGPLPGSQQSRTGRLARFWPFPLLAEAGKGNTQKPHEAAGTCGIHLKTHALTSTPGSAPRRRAPAARRELQTAQPGLSPPTGSEGLSRAAWYAASVESVGDSRRGSATRSQRHRVPPDPRPIRPTPTATGARSPGREKGAKIATINNFVLAHPSKLFLPHHLHVPKCEVLVINARPPFGNGEAVLLPLPERLPAATPGRFNSLTSATTNFPTAQLPSTSSLPRQKPGTRRLRAGSPSAPAHGATEALAAAHREPSPGKATGFNSHIAAATPDALSI